MMAPSRGISLLTAFAILVVMCRSASCQVDSTGVMTYSNTDGSVQELAWQVDGPLLRIGGAGATPEQQLFHVEGALRTSAGVIIVANAGTNELRFYDDNGGLIHSTGGEGDGPGEFRWIERIQEGVDDSVHIFDSRLQRVTAVAANGDLAWVRTLSPTLRSFSSIGRFDDGRWYAVEASQGPGGQRGTLTADSVRILFFDEDLGRHHLGPTILGGFTATFSGLRGETGKLAAPFSPHPVYDEFENCLVVASGQGFDISVYGSRGQLEGIIRNPWDQKEVDDDAVNEWVNARLTPVPDPVRPAMRQVLLRVPAPDRVPAYNDLVVDALGYIWVQKYEPPDGPGRSWLVFRPDGNLMGVIVMPHVLEVYDVGADFILGGWADANGEETVGVFPLHREGGLDLESERLVCR